MPIVTIPARPPVCSAAGFPVVERAMGEQGGARAGRGPDRCIAFRREAPSLAAIVTRSESRRSLASVLSIMPPAGGRISSLIAKLEAARAQRAAAAKFTNSPLK
jgi:hypothetical protein